jgi:hypothetical protein
MKRMMSIAAIALFIAGSSAFACDTCGCKEKKADDKKPACSAKKDDKSCSAKKAEKKCASKCEKKECPADCTKKCCAPKAEAAE